MLCLPSEQAFRDALGGTGSLGWSRSTSIPAMPSSAGLPLRALLASQILAGLFAALPARAQAQPASSDDEVTAAALFVEARALLDRGEHRAACVKFAASLSLHATASTQLNLARCHERAGKLAAAWLAYKRAVVLTREIRLPTRRAELDKVARDALAALEPRLPRMRILVRSPLPGLHVRRDGQPLPTATLGDALPVEPGAHEVEAGAPGYRDMRVMVTAVEGITTEVPIALTPVPPPSPLVGPTALPGRTNDAAARQARRSWGLALVGLGGAGFATGTVAGVMALSQYRAVSPRCPGGGCSPDDRTAVDAYHARALVSTIGFVTAAVGTTTGLILLATARPTRAEAHVISLRAGLGVIAAEGSF